jgi:hypothetical protein
VNDKEDWKKFVNLKREYAEGKRGKNRQVLTQEG